MEKPNQVNIKDLSDFLLSYLIKNQISVNHLKLQKLLYYTQAWHLVHLDSLLFDEEPEAWVNGPVYRSVYDEFKKLGTYNDIDLVAQYKGNIDNLYEENTAKLKLIERQKEFLMSLLKHYGTMSHDKLVFLTHSELPWNEAREGLDPFTYSDRKISLDTMKAYYTDRIEKKRAAKNNV